MTTLARTNGHAPHGKPHSAPALTDRLPPHNLDAERGMLAGMLRDNRLITEVSAFLKASDFYRDSHQLIFSAIIDLHAKGVSVECIALADELIRRDRFKEVGGDDGLYEITESVAHELNTVYFAQIVKDKSVGRNAMDAAASLLRDGYANQFSGQEIRERTLNILNEMQPHSATGSIKRIGDLVDEVWARYLRRAEGELTGLHTGYTKLDDLTDGFQPEQLIVIAGRPSMGKSAYSMNICENQSLGVSGAPTLFVSLEMSEYSITERCMASVARVDSQKFKSGAPFDDDEMRKLSKAKRDIKASPMHLVDRVPSHYLNIVRIIREAHAQFGIRQATVDYLQLMSATGSKDNTTEQLDQMTKAMKDVARELKIPIVLLSQLNRALENRTDKRPLMADLRGSGAIEQHADLVLFLHRPHYYNNAEPEGVAELIVGKNREGPTGKVDLAFLPKSVCFENLDPHRTNPDFGPSPGSAY